MTGELLAVAAVVVPAGAGAAALLHARLARRPAHRLSRPAAITAARRGQWPELLADGWLPDAAPPVADPANPGQVLRLASDPERITGRGPWLLLLAVDPSATPPPLPPIEGGALVALRVPAWMPDPLTAAAWTYDDQEHPVRVLPAVYAGLARRT